MPALKDPWDLGCDPLEALGRGDPAPFEEFVRARLPALVGFFRRLGAGPDEAEDLTQDVFLKLYRSAPRYRRQGTFGAYCMRVAQNAWVDRRRRAALRPRAAGLQAGEPRPGSGPAEPVGREPAPEARLERQDERTLLAEALRQLGPTHAAVFELAVVQGVPYADIARQLGIPVGTVKSRVHHAVRKLRDHLGAAPGVPGRAGREVLP